jgi:hypothetical protein
MMMPVRYQDADGECRAELLTVPGVVGVGATRYEALTALRRELAHRAEWGEIVWAYFPMPGETNWRREPTPEEIAATEEMIAEIYRERDAQKAAEFPE